MQSTRLVIVKDIALGLRYLHTLQEPVGHFDLKPGNVLLMLDGTAKVADFGISREVTSAGCRMRRGTALFRAQEVLLCKRFGVLADVWSFACVLVCVLKWQAQPFDFHDSHEACEKLIADGVLLPSTPCGTNGTLAQIASRCVQDSIVRINSSSLVKALENVNAL